jgi:Raf kinase inhibitor-like YbhB/YbcL family protein
MSTNDPFERFGAVPHFTLTSTDVTDGQPLAADQWGEGGNRSPQLEWSGFPEGTQSFAITIHDPDAPTGSGFWHWAVYDIPADVTSVATGAGADGGGSLPQGAVMLSNEMGGRSFTGAAPPEGTGTHHYNIVVHAVDVPSLGLDPASTPAVLGFTLHFHTLARANLQPIATAGDI